MDILVILYRSDPVLVIVTFIRGQDNLYDLFKPIPLEDILPKYRETYASLNKKRKSSLYFIRGVRNIFPLPDADLLPQRDYVREHRPCINHHHP